jgi:fatty-acyl-CoA synthase
VAATYPGVKIAVTVGVPHDTLGEMVVTCAVPKERSVLDEAAIRDYLKERLASYKVPRRVLFFRSDELAMTGTAKVKSATMREIVAKRLSTENEK